mmetsp:Transcript_102213/g.284710  ORF Transcript_102213/g.284710 Transcript_102213/m.284710 type:complete len:344 (-) Transcript_102213:160-1191(-)
MPQSSKPPTKIGGGKYELEKKLGAGCFGEVYRGRDCATGEQVAIKFEDVSGHALQLEHEVEILKLLAKPTAVQGFATCLYSGMEGRKHCMVMDLLGKSLEERLSSCNGSFNIASTVLVAEQVLRRIEYLHSKCIIHRDIKPENFMFGVKDKVHHLYLIDFGLSKKYYDAKHCQMRMKLSLTGTARYASINAHKGYEQSRRDDLEAIGHMLIYFLRGSLPWSGLEAKTQEEKYRKIREKKESTRLEDLCAGFPDAFMHYLRTTRDLEFKERPNYNHLRKLFRDVRDAEGELQDHDFQWLEGCKDTQGLVPLMTGLPVRQPDDQVPSSSCGFCSCFGGGANAVRD